MRTSLCLSALFLAACGSVKAGPDAAKTIDAVQIDADQTGMATVITQTHFSGSAAVGMPQGNVDVVSTLPNGMTHDQGKTDASGHLSLKVYPGGSVTGIYRHTADTGADLVTYMGVKPNDTLTMGKYWAITTSTMVGAGPMTMSWPAYTGVAGYSITSPCGGVGTGATSYGGFYDYTSCDTQPWGVVGVAYNNQGQPLAMSYTFVTFQSGGSVTLNGWQPAGTAMATMTGLATEITQASVTFIVVTNGSYASYGYGTSAAPTGGAATITFPWVSTGDRTESRIQLIRTGNYYAENIYDGLTSPTVTVAAPQLPPWQSGGILTSPADRKVEWLQYGMPNHSGNVVIVSWQHMMGTSYIPFSWTFIVPPDVTAIDFPKLPSIFDDTQPKPEDSMGVNGWGAILVPGLTNGYDGLRALPEAELTCPACAVRMNLQPRVIVSGALPEGPF